MSTETTQDVLDNNLTCQVGIVVVVRYQIGKSNLITLVLFKLSVTTYWYNFQNALG